MPLTSGTSTDRIEDVHRAHEDQAIEWWFVHGYYEGPALAREYFMTTLFRSSLAATGGGPGNGFHLLAAIVDAAAAPGASHRSLAWVDRPAVAHAVERLETEDLRVDPVLQQAVLEELRDHGPSAPIVLMDPPAVFEAAPFRIRWDDFSLQTSEDGVRLRFPNPATGGVTALDLRSGPRLPVISAAAGMEYQCVPRVALTGTSGVGEPLRGEAWMDHQWGGIDWFHDHAHGAWLGWDWFGLNLDSGVDVVVMRHRDCRTGRTIGRHASTRTAVGATMATEDVTVTPLRFWESPVTYTSYPVTWRIEIRAWDAVLIFEPLLDAQEIPVFGAPRAVWEGAGRVSGTLGGERVSGRARGEFHGYGFVFDHDLFMRHLADRVGRRLEVFLPRRFSTQDAERLIGPATWSHDLDAYTEGLSKPAWDLMDRSGKRWRPIFGLLLLQALGVLPEPWEELICSLELIHAGALVIDDIEDDSQLRRGQQCLHLRYGTATALNAGNALYFLASAAALQHPLLTPLQRGQLLEIKERMFLEAHAGQTVDIFRSLRAEAAEDLHALDYGDAGARIRQMYAYKTAAAPKGVAALACLIANAGPDVTEACTSFGRQLGIAYQIVDDVHNFSRASTWTKVTGEDLVTGKLTYVMLCALRRLDAGARARLATILASPTLRTEPPTRDEGIDLVIHSGALEECRVEARQIADLGWQTLSRHLPASDAKIMLHTMCMRLLDLAYDG